MLPIYSSGNVVNLVDESGSLFPDKCLSSFFPASKYLGFVVIKPKVRNITVMKNSKCVFVFIAVNFCNMIRYCVLSFVEFKVQQFI